MKTPTLVEFQVWAKEHESLALTVCQATAFAQIKKEQVDAYILPIFQKYTFRVDPKWQHRAGETIDKPSNLYLTDEEEKLDAYYAECDKEHRAHGFVGHPDGHCPALVAEHLLIQAENLLLDAGCELLELGHSTICGKLRKKFLDLLLGACLKSLKGPKHHTAYSEVAK